MTDQWVHTIESVGSRNLAGFSSSHLRQHHTSSPYSRLEFDIGLWRVCPSMRSQFFKGLSVLPSDVPCTPIHYLRWWEKMELKDFGLWSPVDCTSSFVSRMRLSTLFMIGSTLLIGIACFFSLLGQCMKGHQMLWASGLHALGGILLGSGLLIFACVLTDECSPAVTGIAGGPNFAKLESEDLKPGYTYGWSFLSALMAFILSKISAILCLTAFLLGFDTEEDFVKTLPGMERKLAEASLLMNSTSQTMMMTDLGGSGSIVAENPPDAPLLKGSFGHHLPSSQNSVDSLYGTGDHNPTNSGLVTSDSIHSVIGLASGGSTITTATVTIPVTAEVNTVLTSEDSTFTPVPAPPSSFKDNDADILIDAQNEVATRGVEDFLISPPPPPPSSMHHHLHHHHHSKSRTTTTLPRNLNTFAPLHQGNQKSIVKKPPVFLNGLNGGHHNGIKDVLNRDDHEAAGFNGTNSYSLRSNGNIVSAMATMPRGSGSLSSGSSNVEKKKKSVTIGTFTTVEHFMDETNFSSAV